MGLLQRLFGGGLQFPLRLEDLEEKTVNDAADYGVVVRHATVTPGEPYWRVVWVHHLTPEENRGRHHIYVEVLDEEGHRVPGAEVRIVSDEGTKVLRVSPDPKKPGIAYPMNRWQMCDVDLLGLPSDQVVGLTSAHPDEGPGNTQFHHSFLIVWQRTVAPAPEVPAPEPVAEAEAPEVAPPPPPEEAPEPVAVPTAQAEVPTPAEEPSPTEAAPAPAAEEAAPEDHVLAPPPPELAAPTAPEPEAAPEEAPTTDVTEPEAAAEPEAPAAEEVTAPEGTPPVAEARTVVEEAPAEAAALAEEAPALAPSGPVYDTYVLFANGEDPATVAAFFLVLEDILAAGIPFGFDTVETAMRARRVIAVGALDEDTHWRLADAVQDVLVVRGDADAIKAQLADALSVG